MLREIDLRRQLFAEVFLFSNFKASGCARKGMAFFYTQKTGCRFEKASFLTGRCRKGRAYQDAGKRQALCQISMIFDLSQINKNDKSEEQSWKKENIHFMTDTRK